jgi:predicted urease superfamily metal-dependent hydrolase
MPQDSIMDMVNNEEPLYNDMNAMFDKWVEEGDVWSERSALSEARALAAHFAEALEMSPYIDGKYSPSDIREAADQMLEDFEQYRDEAIAAAVKHAQHVPTPEELTMDWGDIRHAKKCEGLARKIGIDRLKDLIPASPEKIRKALEKGDKYLNTIPLRKWDAAALSIQGPGLSLSDKVCALKHVAKWHYA